MHYDSPTSIIAIPRMMFLKYLAVVFALLPIIAALDSQALSDRGGPPPVLRINDPFTAPIWRIDVDENEHNAVTGSADKAVTLWNLDDVNREPVIHRVPLRNEEHQRAHASAISPNGAVIAYSVTPEASAI